MDEAAVATELKMWMGARKATISRWERVQQLPSDFKEGNIGGTFVRGRGSKPDNLTFSYEYRKARYRVVMFYSSILLQFSVFVYQLDKGSSIKGLLVVELEFSARPENEVITKNCLLDLGASAAARRALADVL